MASKILLLTLAALMCCVVAEFTATNMHTLNRLGDYAVSSRNQVVYTVSVWDPSTGKTTSNLRSGDKPITPAGITRDFSPMFSPTDPDTVFYLSTGTDGITNLWAASLTNSSTMAPYQVTSFPIDISNVRMTPNYFVFTAEVYESCSNDFGCTARENTKVDGNPNRGIVYDSLFVRHWDIVTIPGKYSQIFTTQITKESSGRYSVYSYRTPRYYPAELQYRLPSMNVPVPPDGGVEQISVIPLTFDRIAFTGAPLRHDTAWNTGWSTFEIRVNPADGTPVSTPAECLTCNNFKNIRTTAPQYDPTGRYLAFLAMDRPGFEADRLHLEVMKVTTGARSTTPIAKNLDRSISEFTWTSDGATILASFDEDGDERIYALALAENDAPKSLILNGSNAGLKVVGNTVYYTHNSYNEATDIRQFTWDSKITSPVATQRVTNLNPSLSNFNLASGEKFYFHSPADAFTMVQGWFFKPKGFQEGGSATWPFVLLVHGGPQGAWNSAWSYRWNPQLWVERGYAVALINPHGSTGFGQGFTDVVSGNWGGVPYHDLMAGVQTVLKEHTWIDSTRLSACGASYGGFMINWFQGNAPTLFSSLVVHDGLFDVPISYGATDELWFPEWEFKGTPWTNSSGYEVWNPARLADKWQTPMLVVHGGRDYRVDLAHGLAAFTTLQRKGIPSKFLFYPEENHWVTRPVNSVQWYSEVLNWLDTYTKFKKTWSPVV